MIALDHVRVAELRRARQLTQDALAELAMVSRHTIQRLESGERIRVRPLTAASIAAALETPLEAITT